MKNLEENKFNILRIISKNPYFSQRKISHELEISLGMVNYCISELIKKGLVKIDNFKKNNNKLNYIYVITPQGITEKSKLTLNFMKRKMQEYKQLKKEIE